MRFRFLALAFVLCLLVSSSPSLAGSNDKEVTELLTGTLADESSVTSNPDAALETLAFAKQACEGTSCSAKVRAQVYIAIGTVLAAGKKKPAEAKEAFLLAFKEDPNATLFPNLKTPEVTKAFDDAKKAAGGGGTSGAGGASGGGRRRHREHPVEAPGRRGPQATQGVPRQRQARPRLEDGGGLLLLPGRP